MVRIGTWWSCFLAIIPWYGAAERARVLTTLGLAQRPEAVVNIGVASFVGRNSKSGVVDDPWEFGERFQRQATRHRLDVYLDQGELRSEVEFLARQYRLAVFLDRRIDPNQPISLRANQLTLEQALWQLKIGDQHAVAPLQNIFYVGPVHAAVPLPELMRELETEIQRAAIEPSRKRNLLASSVLNSGGQLVEPKAWMARLASQADVDLRGVDEIPFDLWAPLNWPPMPVYQQLALLAVGFDLWPVLEPDGAWKLKTFPRRETWRKAYPIVRDPQALQQKLREQVAGLRVSVQRQGIFLEGGVDSLAAAARFIAAWEKPPRPTDTAATFNLKTRASRLAILTAIAEQTDRELDLDDRLRSRLQQVIEVDVVEATAEELIALALAGVDAHFQLSSEKLTIRQK